MKRLWMIGCLGLLCLAVQAQTDATAYLKKYESFVTNVEKIDKTTLNATKIDSLNVIFDQMTAEYHNIYKAKMTDDQLSDYTEYRTRYLKATTIGRTNHFVDKIDSVGKNVTQSVSKAVKKKKKKVSGFVKGIFGKKK